MIEDKIDWHNLEPHECGKALICRVLAGRRLENELEYKEAINILFEVSLICVLYVLIKYLNVYNKLCNWLRIGRRSINTSFTYVDDVYL